MSQVKFLASDQAPEIMSITSKPMAGTGTKPISRRRKFVFALVVSSLSTLVCLGVCEVVFRILEYSENKQSIYQGEGGKWIADNRWGWKPTLGYFRTATSEFDVTGNINSLFMNDSTYSKAEDESCTRLLILGDSHTYAVGVSMEQTWGKVLQKKLNAFYSPNKFRTYNGGVVGYSMHQYLLRLIDQGPALRPQYVILGLSYATDLYDLLPPDRGGWIYGGSRARDYFDFDSQGELVEKHWDPVAVSGIGTKPTTPATTVREILEYSAIFRYLRRSRLALFFGSHVKIKGQSLWPNMDIVVEKNVTPEHEYQWRLFQALLTKMNAECEHQGAELIVVGIPYLPQIYDEIWNSTFGQDQKYSRTAGADRVAAACKNLGIVYVDSLDAFQSKSRQVGHWLHYHKDAHPTSEGQEVIADTVMQAGVIHARSPRN
jgi:lysophospholipase L1-like esterase